MELLPRLAVVVRDGLPKKLNPQAMVANATNVMPCNTFMVD